MDKPKSLSVKDYIIRKMSVKMMMSEKTIDAVVVHQFTSANAAMKDNDSLEISGFGKFLFNKKKALRMLEKFESQKRVFTNILATQTLSEKKRANMELKLQTAIEHINDLKPKLYNEPITDLRGMEEQVDSSQGDEGADREDI